LKKAATTILSASMDKSMVLWTFDDNQKMYIDKVKGFLIDKHFFLLLDSI